MNSIILQLHAHLPYVRHPEWDNFLEEQWLFEAVCETYGPLVLMLEELRRDSVPARLTMTMSPTLLLMLDDELLHTRILRYIDTRLNLLDDEAERHAKVDAQGRLILPFNGMKAVRDVVVMDVA